MAELDNRELISRMSQKEAMQLLETTRPFTELMTQYKCAMMEIETKLNVLNAEFSLAYSRNPIESIKSRLKSPLSIMEKLNRKGFAVTARSIEENLTDVAGIRVICSFVEDIYTLEKMLTVQDDIKVLTRKDYIAEPKPNGYRSLHLILDIPIFLTNQKKHMKVEVQFRTIAMDFWASLEHKLKYKKNIADAEAVAIELKECADTISAMDNKMQELHNRIQGIKEAES